MPLKLPSQYTGKFVRGALRAQKLKTTSHVIHLISVFLRDFVALWGRAAGFQYLYIKISVCWPCLPRQQYCV
jgi:hypothetical protein